MVVDLIALIKAGLTDPDRPLGVLFFKGIASANTVDTGDGLVMLDTGSRADTRPLHEAVRRWRPHAPLAAAVFSHHHVDHVFGVGPFEREAAERRWPRPRVYAHALVRANFERYQRTLGWNTAIKSEPGRQPIQVQLQGANGLLERLLEGAPNRHHFTDRLHLRG